MHAYCMHWTCVKSYPKSNSHGKQKNDNGKTQQKILFIELMFGSLMSEMAQNWVDKMARLLKKVKVDKTTKTLPST